MTTEFEQDFSTNLKVDEQQLYFTAANSLWRQGNFLKYDLSILTVVEDPSLSAD